MLYEVITDNLAPKVPTSLAQSTHSFGVKLAWDDPVDDDFNYFEIYRSTKQGFNPNAVFPLGTTVSPEYVDETVEVGSTRNNFV